MAADSSRPVVIVTGASRGLGLAIASILLERHNARVATLSRSKTSELAALGEKYGEDFLSVQGDVAKSEDNESVVKQAVDRWGRLDGLVLNAGTVEPFGKLADLPQSEFEPYLRTNLLSALYLLQPALPYLRKTKGKVVIVSSGASTRGYQVWGLYSMAKAGLNSLCRTLAAEERSNGVGCWAIRPGVIDTTMAAVVRDKGKEEMAPNEYAKFHDAHAKGELLAPERPGGAIAHTVINGPMDLSGEYLQWDDERLAPSAV